MRADRKGSVMLLWQEVISSLLQTDTKTCLSELLLGKERGKKPSRKQHFPSFCIFLNSRTPQLLQQTHASVCKTGPSLMFYSPQNSSTLIGCEVIWSNYNILKNVFLCHVCIWLYEPLTKYVMTRYASTSNTSTKARQEDHSQITAYWEKKAKNTFTQTHNCTKPEKKKINCLHQRSIWNYFWTYFWPTSKYTK